MLKYSPNKSLKTIHYKNKEEKHTKSFIKISIELVEFLIIINVEQTYMLLTVLWKL